MRTHLRRNVPLAFTLVVLAGCSTTGALSGAVEKPALLPAEASAAALLGKVEGGFHLSAQERLQGVVRTRVEGDVDVESCRYHVRTAYSEITVGSDGASARITSLSLGELVVEDGRGWYVNRVVENPSEALLRAVSEAETTEELPGAADAQSSWLTGPADQVSTNVAGAVLIGLAGADIVYDYCETLPRLTQTLGVMQPLRDLSAAEAQVPSDSSEARPVGIGTPQDEALLAADDAGDVIRHVGRFELDRVTQRQRRDLWRSYVADDTTPTKAAMAASLTTLERPVDRTRIEVLAGTAAGVVIEARSIPSAALSTRLELTPRSGAVTLPERARTERAPGS